MRHGFFTLCAHPTGILAYLRKHWLLPAVLLLGSCSSTAHVSTLHTGRRESHRASPTVIPVIIDDTFAPDDVVSIIDAVDIWNDSLNQALVLRPFPGPITVSVMESTAIVIMRVDSSCHFIPTTPDGAATRVLAFADAIGGSRVWIIRDRIGTKDVRAITLHELGHVLGSHHHDFGLMKPIFNLADYMCVDQFTAQDVAEHRNIPLSSMTYCILPIY